MGELIDKVKGAVNEALGKNKQARGKASGDGVTQAEGVGQQIKGKAQKASGAVKGAMGDKI